VQSIHKLTAGDGYAYLTRQVAALDATDRGHTGLGDYYTRQGESPGTWLGSALADVGMQAGEPVTADQMAALFAEGLHPNADAIRAQLLGLAPTPHTAADLKAAREAALLGRPYDILDTAPAFRVEVARQAAAANTALGLPRDTPLAAAERARIRTDVGRAMFTDQYGRGPGNPRELSSFIARNSRQSTSAVAGYDLTFSPIKSVSALWAIAPKDVAEQILAAHHAAVRDTIGWLEREAIYTRTGHAGVQQIDTTGVLAAAFDHRDSRAGDPDLHTHVAVSNKVRVRTADGTPGRWLALDGRVLFKATVSSSERYNTRLEAELHTRLGLTFEERSDASAAAAAGRRSVREVVGIPENLSAAWSSRRAAIDTRRAVLAVKFQADHGRPPTPIEAVKLAQQATLETRDAKHEPRSEAEQRRVWRGEAAAVLGGERAVDDLAATVTKGPVRDPTRVSRRQFLDIVGWTGAVVEEHRSTWQVWHVRAEAERQVRAQAPAGADVDRLVERVVRGVLDPRLAIPLTPDDAVQVPDALRRADGVSVYEVAGSRLYTSAEVLINEASVVQAAHRLGGRTVRVEDVDVALLESVANGVTLNTAQAHLVRQMATSGRRVQLAIAPAGSGKTTAMAALTAAWTGSGGTVVGLAPSAVAAAILGQETGTHADTLAKLTIGINTGNLPGWAQKIDQRTLLIVDEAGMASTRDLAAVTRFALQRGASIRLIGDDRQLTSVSAGGLLRDIKAAVGVVTLTELIRFRDQAEGAASLALRTGDTTAIGFYLDRDRVHVGDLTTVTDHAYTAWTTDRAAGLDTVMLAPTRDLVTGLNIRARNDRLHTLIHDGRGGLALGQQVALVDGSAASEGDLVITRRNNRQLRMTATDWVKNGDRWNVTAVHDDGALAVAHSLTGRLVTLPADYVAAHVQLGYATTVHGAQGVTADTAHTVTTGDESRQQLYVALTRGRDANHLYLVTAMDGDEHSVITPAATHPHTAANVLEQVLARDEAQTSATTAREQAGDIAAQLATADARYRDSLAFAAAHIHGPGWTEALEAAVDQVVPGITESPAWPTLRGHLALLAADGQDPVAAFTAALAAREIDTAADPAAVLDWRLDPTHTRSANPGPLPWSPGIPQRLTGDPYWGQYLTARATQVTESTAEVRAAAHAYTAATAPSWARLLLADQHQQLRADVAVFRAAHAVPGDDTRPTGKPQLAAADRRTQKALDTWITEAIDTSYRTAWTPLAVQVGLHPHADPHWPVLVEHLAALSRAGADAPALLRAAAAEAPLPDEYQAAAIWWRIARHTSPAVLTPDAGTARSGPADPLRPPWLDQLTATLNPAATAELVGDPHWAAVVTAVNRAIDHGVPANVVLRQPVGPDGNPVPDHALADALIYRAATLTDPLPPDPDQPNRDLNEAGVGPWFEPDDPDFEPPEDLHMLSYTGNTGQRVYFSLNLDDEGYRDGPVFDHYLNTGDREPPLPDETIPTSDVALTARDLDGALFQAAAHRQWMDPLEPTDEQQNRLEARAYDADCSPVTPERIADLNTQAADYYTQTYRGSWAQTYLTGRLGTDLTGDPHIQPGYAPAGFTHLVDHLRRRGATDDELLAAGLAKTASTAATIDTFRDRLILPIHHQGTHGVQGVQVVGFVGRRDPGTDRLEPGTPAAVKAGPKYLNTGETVLFAKGDQLYGMAEFADRLTAGATPVLVEGPIDVLAVSLAGPDHVGVAPLGTSLTDTQADTLTPHLTSQGGVIVATDGDLAGQLAAERDYWLLTARGGDPLHVTFPTGQDPAGILTTQGPAALQDLMTHPHTLARTLVDERLNHLPPAQALPAALTIVAAGDAQRWTRRATDIAHQLHLPADVALTDLLGHITTWDRDRHRAAAVQIGAGQDTRARLTQLSTLWPEHRWAPFARQIDRDLVRGPGWPMLADTIDLADRHGVDVHTLLPTLAKSEPLDPARAASDLAYRLVANTDFPIESPIVLQPRQQRISATRTPSPIVSPTRRPDTTPGR
jgi:DNA primase catalytic core